jgi:hypothetical protein
MALENTVEYEQEGLEVLGSMNRPIPGESLTNSPESPRTWEQAPEYTNTKDALDFIVGFLIEEQNYTSIIGAIGEGIPISDVVQQILYGGFSNGKWNPDLFLVLVEPLMYVLMALCEKAGVTYTLYRGEEEDEANDNIEGKVEIKGKELKSLADMIEKKANKGNITSVTLPREIALDIEQVEVPQSLMAKPEEEEAPPTNTPENTSLLGR